MVPKNQLSSFYGILAGWDQNPSQVSQLPKIISATQLINQVPIKEIDQTLVPSGYVKIAIENGHL